MCVYEYVIYIGILSLFCVLNVQLNGGVSKNGRRTIFLHRVLYGTTPKRGSATDKEILFTLKNYFCKISVSFKTPILYHKNLPATFSRKCPENGDENGR